MNSMTIAMIIVNLFPTTLVHCILFSVLGVVGVAVLDAVYNALAQV